MIVPARVTEAPRRILRAAPAGIEVDDALSISEQVSSGIGVAVPRSGSPRLPSADDGQMCPISDICQPGYNGSAGEGGRHSFSYRRLIKT